MPACKHCPPLRRAAGGLSLGGQATILPFCGTQVWPAVVNAVITGGPAPGTYPLTFETDPDEYWDQWWINKTIDIGSTEGTGLALQWFPDPGFPSGACAFPIEPLFNPDADLIFDDGLTCNPFRLTFNLTGSSAGITVVIEMP